MDEGFAEGTIDGVLVGRELGVDEGTDDGAELRDGALLGIFDGHASMNTIAWNSLITLHALYWTISVSTG